MMISHDQYEAVIFDLDGVVTRTASVHAAAWKQLFDEYREERLKRNLPVYEPFDEDNDYREYVDGNPRYDGIESFLSAHDINSPHGVPNDSPDKKTICGLGNRNNELWHKHLECDGVDAYDSTVELIHHLQEVGFKTAIISASKNCAAVLEAAGLQDLFQVRVDGVEAEKLDLAGKPEPDVFVEAAIRLEIEPERAVIVEDAVAGVQAGRKGGFGLVIGIDRSGNPERLRENGADEVVSVLSEVVVHDESSSRDTTELPSALEAIDEIDASHAKRLAVFLDYDGTLTPIVAHPEDAILSEEMRDTIRRLAKICSVAVVSGRDLADVRERVGLDEIVYAGSHGFDIGGPDGPRGENPEALDFLPVLDEAVGELREQLAGIEGEQVERKKYAIAIHFRNAPEESVADIEQAVDAARSNHPKLRKGDGKKIFELQPDIDWHKGHAVKWLLKALAATWRAEDWSGRMEVRSALDGRVTNDGVPRYRNLNGKHLVPIETDRIGDNSIYLKVRTSQSELHIAQAARMHWSKAGERVEPPVEATGEAGYIAQHFTLELTEGESVTAEKVVSLFNSRDRAISECGLAARNAVEEAEGFAGLLHQHRQAWRHLWERFDMEMEFEDPEIGRHRTPLILHLHIFDLLQTTSPHIIDMDTGLPSRGWHGNAYRGHIFWDELFIFPMLNLRIPDLTRALLKYRSRRLDAARRGARAAGYAGAMYPWQSGSDGREETQVLHLNPKSGRWLPDNSHLQRDINAAVVYNIWHHYQITGDREFLVVHGIEIMLEIARFWASLATYNEELDRYEILGVMGPDEYHDSYPDRDNPGLDNNSYTNLMAVWVLCRALDVFDVIPEEHCSCICAKLDVKDAEIAHLQDISRKMRPIVHEGGILSQFEGYSELEEFDWKTYQEKHGQVMRLDRILEAEDDTPNRYKASKQADVLMLFYLFSAEELEQLFERLGYPFDPEMIRRNINYSLERTSNGSTLSDVVNSWVLARSDRARSWYVFTEALKSDIADVQGGTTPEGIHLGAMAGTVDLIQRCYTGIEPREDVLWINPQLPDELACLRLRIRYREASLDIEVTHHTLNVRVVYCPGAPIRIGFRDRVMEMKEGENLEMDLANPHPFETPETS
jgi:alpha,alpha-trehalase